MTTTITLDAAVLERVLANGILFTAPAKDCLPALETVRFDWDGDTLLAVATNRYVLSTETVDYHGDGNTEGRDSFSIGVNDAKRVIAMLKAVRLPRFPVSVKYDGEAGKATFNIGGDMMIVSTEHGGFPDWRRLTGGFKPAEHDSIMFNPQYLALLTKVKGDYKNAPMRFEFAEGIEPARVTIGEAFTALIIPIRNAGS